MDAGWLANRVPMRTEGALEIVLQSQRMGNAQLYDAYRECLLEQGLPPVVVHHGGDAAHEILERAEQQRTVSREGLGAVDITRKPAVEVFAPCVDIRIGRRPQAWVMVSVEVVVGIDETGHHHAGTQIDVEVRRRVGIGDSTPRQ